MAGLAPGWWHYDGQTHRLNKLIHANAGAGAGAGVDVDVGAGAGEPGAAAELVATAIFARSGHKYRDRTYRYVLGDLGHLLENARATAAALGAGLWPQRLFDEALLARELNLDEAQEGVLAWMHFGDVTGDVTEPSPGARTARTAQAMLHTPSGPWAAPVFTDVGQPAVLGVTDAVHRATSLRAGAAPTRPAAPALVTAVSLASELRLPLARAVVAPDQVQALIARRRSVRRFSDQALPLETLGAVLHHMALGHPALFSDAVRLDLVSHAVQGLPSTAWRYDAARHALQRRREGAVAREMSRRAALGQDAIGDAAVVMVLSIDRAALAQDAGGAARGYRHAFIESGLVGERLYLAGEALGLGVCAVGAFYDDEASRLVNVDPAREWVVHFAALGVPA